MKSRAIIVSQATKTQTLRHRQQSSHHRQMAAQEDQEEETETE